MYTAKCTVRKRKLNNSLKRSRCTGPNRVSVPKLTVTRLAKKLKQEHSEKKKKKLITLFKSSVKVSAYLKPHM